MYEQNLEKTAETIYRKMKNQIFLGDKWKAELIAVKGKYKEKW